MTTLTLYELMAEDHVIFADLKPNGEVHVVVTDTAEHEIVYSETGHIYAWESLVNFAQQVLDCDTRIQNELKLKEDV